MVSEAWARQRVPLGGAVVYFEQVATATGFEHKKIFCMVVGVWFLDYVGPSTRAAKFNVDPRDVLESSESSGYVLLPSGQSNFIYAWYGDIDNGLLELA